MSSTFSRTLPHSRHRFWDTEEPLHSPSHAPVQSMHLCSGDYKHRSRMAHLQGTTPSGVLKGVLPSKFLPTHTASPEPPHLPVPTLPRPTRRPWQPQSRLHVKSMHSTLTWYHNACSTEGDPPHQHTEPQTHINDMPRPTQRPRHSLKPTQRPYKHTRRCTHTSDHKGYKQKPEGAWATND
jgi:hypothetical protein